MSALYFTKQGGPHDQALIIDEETGRSIAVCYTSQDAPLLSAAPDLLGACRALAAAYDAGGEEGEHPGSVEWSDLDAAVEIARAAIAKATGATE